MSTKKASSQNDSHSNRVGGIHLDVSSLHHAYCLVGNRSLILPALLDTLARDLALPMGNSDLLLLDYEGLKIEDSRNIKEYASTRANGERRAIVISAHTIHREAQNALLKSFEDTGEGLHFFLIIPSAHILLPTLRSRLSFIDTSSLYRDDASAIENPDKISAAEFILMSYKGRLEFIKELADDIKDEQRQKQEGIDLIKELQKETSQRYSFTTEDTIGSVVQKEILIALSYANDTSASLKMLLEHLALVIPIGKNIDNSD